jgi:hypothetical protein
MCEHDEYVQDAKRGGGHDKEVDGNKVMDVVPEKRRQVCDGGFRRCGMYRDTVASETLKPSMSNSAWMRGAPQVGFSRAIRTMSVGP